MRRARPLSAFLAQLIWLSVLPLVLVAAWLAIGNVLTRQAEIQQEAANMANNFAIAIDHFLSARIGALHVLAVSPLADEPKRWPELYAEAQGFRGSFGSHVILADVGNPMQMLFNTRSPFGDKLPALPHPKGHAAAPTALETGRPAIGDSFMGPIAQEPMVAIAVPGVRSGKVTHLLLTIIETVQFQQRIEQESLPAKWALSLTDGKGVILAQRKPPDVNTQRDVDADGRFVVRSKVSPWSVVLEIPRDVYTAPLVSVGIQLLLAIAAATAAGVLGGMLAGQRLARQVAALASLPASESLPSINIAEIAAVRQVLDDSATSLRMSEIRFATTFEHASVGIAQVGLEGKYLLVNRTASTMFGYSQDEMLSMTWQQLTCPDDLEIDLEYIRRLIAGEIGFYAREKRFVANNRKIFWAKIGVTLIRKVEGAPEYFIVVVENIQARKEAEAALIEQSTLLNDMGAMAHVGGWVFDPETGKGNWTPEAARIHDLPGDAPIDVATGLSYYIEAHQATIMAAVRAAVEHGRPYDLELEIHTCAGTRKWVRTIGHPIVENGKVLKVCGAIQDLTQRKLAEIELAKSEQHYRELVEYANSAIIHWSRDGIITFFNPFAQQLFGWNAAEIIGQPIAVLVPAQDSTGADLSTLVEDIAAHPERYQQYAYENIRRDGKRIWMNWTNRAIRDEQGSVTGILTVGNDISEQKRTVEELKRRNDELERFDLASVGRELQMIELKRQINDLSQQLGRTPPFDLSFGEGP
jgi:PAS domain S-box-containing protein